MKSILSLLMLFATTFVFSQDILGQWKTIDDESGKEKSIVEIYKHGDKIYGKIVKLIHPKQENPLCTRCEGSKKDKPILGMVIIEGLENDNGIYTGGTILNPKNGKEYKCRLKLEDDNHTLQVRGYVALFYKTQYWKRLSE